MSTMPGNQHYEVAAKASIFIDNKLKASDQEFVAHSQVEATLALAYEQRTANLIAAAGMVGTDLTGLPDKSLLHWVDLAQTINSRLGLDTK